MTTVPYAYNGQQFEFRMYNGQIIMVTLNGMPVAMYMRGSTTATALGGADPKAVAAADAAAKAYRAGTPSGSAGGGSAAPAAAPAGGGLTVDGVISLVNAGISDDIILAKIQKSGQAFDLSTDDLVKLKKAKASDTVVKAMMSATAAPAPAAAPVATAMSAAPAAAPAVAVAPNPVADNPNMGKLKKGSFFGDIGHGVSKAAQGKTVIDDLSMRNILPQWDPNKSVDQQYPHIAITVLYAPGGWTDDYHEVNRKRSLIPPCFKLKAVVWLDATRSKNTDEFQWCSDKDEMMTQLQPTYLFSFTPGMRGRSAGTGINRTDGPEPPETLLPNDRATLDMEAKTNPQGASKDLNLDELSLFAIMFANVRKDLGETLGSDGDFRVWVTSIKKAAGPSL